MIERRDFFKTAALSALALFAPKVLIAVPEKKIFTGMGFVEYDLLTRIRRATAYANAAGDTTYAVALTDDHVDELKYRGLIEESWRYGTVGTGTVSTYYARPGGSWDATRVVLPRELDKVLGLPIYSIGGSVSAILSRHKGCSVDDYTLLSI